MLTNPYFVAVAVPLILIVCGGLAKKLGRQSGFRASDFFLGVELALAAFGSSLTEFIDLSKKAKEKADAIQSDALIKNGSYLAICFFFILIILATHQIWEEQKDYPYKRCFWLGFFSNAMGCGLMIGFILYVKGLSQ